MTTIQLKFRPASAEAHEGTLYYLLTHDRHQRVIRTNYRLFPDEWDDHTASIITDRHRDRLAHLRLLRATVCWEQQQMQRLLADRTAADCPCSVDDLARALRLLLPSPTVFAFFRQQIAVKEQMRCIGTRNNYATAARRFMAFRNHEDLTFAEMSADMMERYQTWLRHRGACPNTVAFYLRTLRTLYRKAVAAGHAPQRDLFAGVQTAGVRTAKRAIGLTDIRRIERLQLPSGSSLERARDLFLLSFYLRGMAFVDMAFLRKSDLRGGVVVYNRRKTHQRLCIEWERPMQALVDKYADQTLSSPYLLPILTGHERDPYAAYRRVEHNTNYHLKTVGRLAGLRLPLTTYVARHTWASIALRLNIPIATISEGMGHTSYHTTQIYLASIDQDTVNEANKKIIRHVLSPNT